MRKFRKKIFKYYAPWAIVGGISLGLMVSAGFINQKHHPLLYNLLEIPGLCLWIISLWCLFHVQQLRARAQRQRQMAHLNKMLKFLQQSPSQQAIPQATPNFGATAQAYFVKAAAQRAVNLQPAVSSTTAAIHKLNAPGRKK